MKATNLIDAAIEMANYSVVVELPDGKQMTITGFVYGNNKRGEPVLVLKTGRKLIR